MSVTYMDLTNNRIMLMSDLYRHKASIDVSLAEVWLATDIPEQFHYQVRELAMEAM